MTPSAACTTVMAIPRNAIAMRERTLVAISTVSNKATLREAAYRAKLSSLPGPSRPVREKPALTPALRSVTRAQLQNRFVIEHPPSLTPALELFPNENGAFPAKRGSRHDLRNDRASELGAELSAT